MGMTFIRTGAVAAYAALAFDVVDGGTELGWLAAHPWPALVTVHLALGLAVARWWALLVPMLPVVFAVPESNWDCGGGFECIAEPLALWVLAGALFVAVPCVGLGVAIAKRLYSGEKNSSRLPSGS